MFEVNMFPAKEGDCFLVRYGEEDAPRQMLIDVGRKATFRLLEAWLPHDRRHLELFVVSHVDRDHIEGALEVLGNEGAGFTFDDVWFNAYRHLDWHADSEEFGAVQGEKLTRSLLDRHIPWNRAFDGGPVRIEDAPVERVLPGGMRLTLLSPDPAKLLALEPRWEEECRRAGLDPTLEAPAEADPTEDPDAEEAVEYFGGSLEDLAATETKEDSAAPNGSSIAFLAEFEGKTVLFGADAHPSLLVRSLRALGRPLPIDCALVKVPHHGSQANTTRELLDCISSDAFLISTNGSYFDHPDAVAIARLVTQPGPSPKTLYFNYDQEHTRIWAEGDQPRGYGYDCVFPGHKDQPITIAL